MPVHQTFHAECNRGLEEALKGHPLHKLQLSSPSSSVSSSSLHSLSPITTNDSYDINNITTPAEPSIKPSRLFVHDKPHTTAVLRPGAIFVGTQQSGRSMYEVRVELKYVDLDSSFVSGYIKINGLSESHPELTTFFEGEIISDQVSFYTHEKSWGASDEIDIQHWSKFVHWKTQLPVQKILNKTYVHKDPLCHSTVYMRWKEHFLVPDARANDLEGASFAGFYYISFNQLTGSISGLYYHRSSERFQQLELNHVHTKGVCPTFEFM